MIKNDGDYPDACYVPFAILYCFIFVGNESCAGTFVSGSVVHCTAFKEKGSGLLFQHGGGAGVN